MWTLQATDRSGAAGGGGGQKVTFWENEWNAIKTAHSSWYNGVDFYTGGTLTMLSDYYRISQENPWSFEQFLAVDLL